MTEPQPGLTIQAGKGGVGKTTISTALALALSQHGKFSTAIIDFDGGHSVGRTINPTLTIPINTLHSFMPNLHVGVVENTPFKSIADTKTGGGSMDTYLAQFPGHYGLIPFCDMVTEFFGVPTDVAALQKFLTLVKLIKEAREKGIKHIIVDVEPTAGLERLLTNAKAIVRSLRNLQTQGVVKLMIIGTTWPDIAHYLKGAYIKNVATFCEEIEATVKALVEARYNLVCIAEPSPALQTFEVSRIIQGFGGKVERCIVNNMRGEPQEAAALQALAGHDLPILQLNRVNGLYQFGDGHTAKLIELGRQIANDL
ncbi:MAG: hypothetical protein RL094_811 [Candidatus Parcubacteria bacterium]|jgi:anion-transporting  ArsA/GET3 family ATPase